MGPYKAYFPEFWNKHGKKLENLGKRSITSIFLYEFCIDKEGIIYMQKKFLEGTSKIYFPITIIQTALDCYNEYIQKKDLKARDIFLKYSEWLIKNSTTTKAGVGWLHTWKMNIAGYKFKKPYKWISGITQGMALNVFIRAHSLTGKKKYLDACKGIIKTFETPVSKGGILDVDKEGNWWYEEYPGYKRAHVLNGFIYALLGLYEYQDYTKDKKAKKLFEKGIKTLETNIESFNINLGLLKWSRYDTGKIFYSGKRYHKTVHMPQIKILHQLIKKEIFLKQYREWLKYSKRYSIIAKLVDLPLLGIIKIRGLIGI
ncbi:D-glucuronyl C5-epimerase family protein [Nanoarchaeota archaeon]